MASFFDDLIGELELTKIGLKNIVDEGRGEFSKDGVQSRQKLNKVNPLVRQGLQPTTEDAERLNIHTEEGYAEAQSVASIAKKITEFISPSGA